jgi:hypothetical protein
MPHVGRGRAEKGNRRSATYSYDTISGQSHAQTQIFFPQSARNETMNEVRCRSLTTREVGRLSVLPVGGECWDNLSFTYKYR